jgi:glutamate dehydrogenase/leucine dehydrogenase
MDMNCGPSELRAIYQGAGVHLGDVTDTSWFTALTVFHCLQSCAATLQISGRPVTLAIDGFGSVARHLAERLPADQFRIVAVSTIAGAVKGAPWYEPADLARRRTDAGDAFIQQLPGEPIERGSVLAVEADIALPSARTRVISRELAARMQARAVVPIANAPYDDGALSILAGKGILCLPGYLSNSGGVLASSLYDQGIPRATVEALLAEHYRPIADGILRVAARRRQSAVEVSAALAQLHMPARARARTRSLARRIHERFLKPRLPRGWRAQTARRVFVANSRAVRQELAQWEQTG